MILGSEAGSTAVNSCFSVDVEDWFHGFLPMAEWSKYTARIDRGLSVVLDLMAERNVKGTFFVLGCVANDQPQLVKKIAAAGHEIGSHTYTHEFVYNQTSDQFLQEIRKTKTVLEQITGLPCLTHRSPYFSITPKCLWALDVLAEEGFTSDSSMIPVTTWLYGVPNCPDYIFKLKETGLIQFPVSPIAVLGKKIALGGAYFRMMPYRVSARELTKRVNTNKMSMFYIHPWEYDPGHPKMMQHDKMVTFGHYVKLGKTASYTAKLLDEFSFTTMAELIARANSNAPVPEIAVNFFANPSKS